jgi:hypothetical protein
MAFFQIGIRQTNLLAVNFAAVECCRKKIFARIFTQPKIRIKNVAFDSSRCPVRENILAV